MLVVVPPQPAASPRQRLEMPKLGKTLMPREQVEVDVELTGLDASNGKQLQLVLGQMGCGFSTFASGTLRVRDGAAQLHLSGVPSNLEADLFVFEDTDHDGLCTAADTLLQGKLTTTEADLSASFELSSLTPAAEWMCFPFTR